MTDLMLLAATWMVLIWWASSSVFRLRGVTAIAMVLITVTAPKLVSTEFGITNMGVALYAAVMTAQTILLMTGHRSVALGTIPMVFFTLICAVVSFSVIAAAPVVPGNEDAAAALSALMTFSLRIVVASFLAFLLSQLTLVWCFDAMHAAPALLRGIGAQLIAQTADSAVFFPVAFGNTSLGGLIEIGGVGLAAKLVLTLLMAPLLVLNRTKHGRSVSPQSAEI